MWKHVKNLRESAAFDPEKQMPPKDIYFDADALENWFEQREQLRGQSRDSS